MKQPRLAGSDDLLCLGAESRRLQLYLPKRDDKVVKISDTTLAD